MSTSNPNLRMGSTGAGVGCALAISSWFSGTLGRMTGVAWFDTLILVAIGATAFVVVSRIAALLKSRAE
jgi:hypothetical protein